MQRDRFLLLWLIVYVAFLYEVVCCEWWGIKYLNSGRRVQSWHSTTIKWSLHLQVSVTLLQLMTLHTIGFM